MNSSTDSYSEGDDSLLTYSSSSSDIDDEIDLTKWTAAPTVNRDPFQFVGNREVLVEKAQSPIDFWNYVFPKHLVQTIVHETNQYAEKICSNPRSRRSRVNQWERTNIEEFNVFISLLISQGFIKKPELQMYFTTDELLSTPIFNKLITVDRFQLLLKMLHFQTDQGSDNTLKKILPVVEILRSSFKSLYRPRRTLNVDESLHLYKGRLFWKQYIPLKRARFGFKFFMLCDITGYILDFIIYTGNDTNYNKKYNDLPLSSRIVLTLVEDYLDVGHCIVMDNYYSSPELFLQLVKRNTDALGTVRCNRKSLPSDLKTVKLRKNERIARYYNKLMALNWHDKKYVHMLSTYHKNDTTFIQKHQIQIEKPTCIHEYNDMMGGVDMADQLTAAYSIPRKRLKKYYKKIFMVLLDFAILNSWVVPPEISHAYVDLQQHG